MAKAPKKKELTDKEYAFVMEYLKDSNGARAARVCGYDANKPQNARFTAHAMLTKTHIKAFIQDHKDKIKERSIVTQAKLLDQLQEIAGANIIDYYNCETEDGMIELKDLPNPRAIKELTIHTRTDDAGNSIRTATFKLHDSIKANESIRKLMGLDKQSDEVVDREINININYNKQDK